MTDWTPDEVLGGAFECRVLPLGPDEEGEVEAVLVRRACGDRPSKRAVVYLHGFNDYFFNAQIADRFNGWGYDFYALDLRRYGRALKDWQTPVWVGELSEYFDELDEAFAEARAGREFVVFLAHSMGGLIGSLYAHERRQNLPFQAMILNAPFFAVLGTRFEPAAARVAQGLSQVLPKRFRWPEAPDSTYAYSLHHSMGGEWDYRLDWKRARAPIYVRWVRAVTLGHSLVRRGLAVPCPVLSLSSSRSSRPRNRNDPRLFETDVVLPANRIAELSKRIGPKVTVRRIEGGLHDLFLSRKEVRDEVYEVIYNWIALIDSRDASR